MMFRIGGPGVLTKPARILAGLVALALGASFLLALIYGEPNPQTQGGALFLAYLICSMLIASGALLMLSVFAGVGEDGARPATMHPLARFVLDSLGWLFLVGLALTFTLIALTDGLGGNTFAAIAGRIAFGAVALLIWALIGHGVVEAIRGRRGGRQP